jgi:Family of unknown function (DUF6220)
MTVITAPAALSGYRATFATITRILAMLAGTLCVVQFALAGFGAFDAFQKHHGFRPHEVVGNIIGGITILILIAALVAHASRTIMIQAVGLFLLAAPIQPLLAEWGKHHPWVGALHALVGLLILGACFGLSRRLPGTAAAAGPVVNA